MEQKIILNEEQQTCADKMAEFCRTINSGERFNAHNMMSFSGPAGTGKTTTLQTMMDTLPEDSLVFMSAMTNRAAKNIGDGVPTVYKSLGLYIKMDEDTGEYVIKQRDDWKPVVNSVVVVDEASMITRNLMDVMFDLAEHYNMGFIFVGDRYQLPAVGEAFDVFDGIFPIVELTKIMRQAEGNPIQQWGQYLRECIKCGRSPEYLSPHVSDDGGIHEVPRDTARAMMLERASEKADSFAVAFTNKTTEDLNILMRQGNFSTRPPTEDEILTVGTAITISRRNEDTGNYENVMVATTNSMPLFTMEPYEDKTFEGVEGLGVTVNSEYDGEWYPGLIPVDFTAYIKTKSELKTQALEIQQSYKAGHPDVTEKDRRAAWARFYRFSETFFDLRPTYAGTVHKAQGCTYDEVFIDLKDLTKARHVGDPMTRESQYTRLLYVALTRARSNVFYYL